MSSRRFLHTFSSLANKLNYKFLKPIYCDSTNLSDYYLTRFSTYKAISEKKMWNIWDYFNEDVDELLKLFKPVLDNIYKKYSGKKYIPGQKPFMSFEEFKKLCSDAGIMGNLGDKELGILFGMAMTTQIEQTVGTKKVEMNYTEFLVAFCRVCWNQPNLPEHEEMDDETKFLRKIDKALRKCFNLCSKNLKDNFKLPQEYNDVY